MVVRILPPPSGCPPSADILWHLCTKHIICLVNLFGSFASTLSSLWTNTTPRRHEARARGCSDNLCPPLWSTKSSNCWFSPTLSDLRLCFYRAQASLGDQCQPNRINPEWISSPLALRVCLCVLCLPVCVCVQTIAGTGLWCAERL